MVKRVSAVVPRALRQPAIVPFSDANTKRSPLKDAVPLNTCPVTGSEPVGIATTSPCLTPSELYSVAWPEPLSETQNGLVAENEMPQGLTRSGSVAWLASVVWPKGPTGPARPGEAAEPRT